MTLLSAWKHEFGQSECFAVQWFGAVCLIRPTLFILSIPALVLTIMPWTTHSSAVVARDP